MKLGDPKAKADRQLDIIDVPAGLQVSLTCTEFTCRCPVTNQPDWATIVIEYIVNLKGVESKSLKMWLETWRDVGIFHEPLTMAICEAIFEAILPWKCKVTTHFNTRGGIAISSSYTKSLREEHIRFWRKVRIRGFKECWDWLGYTRPDGYGEAGMDYDIWLAHRLSWTLVRGAIPEGLCVLHRCDNPRCVNPYHLFLGTRTDNATDRTLKGRSAKKLTAEKVLEIRQLLAADRPLRQIARQFGVSNTMINYIKLGKSWAWLKEEQ